MTDVVVRKFFNVLELSAGAQQPLPPAVQDLLTEGMRYKKVVHLRGRDRYCIDPVTGERETRHVRIEHRKLFEIDKYGRLICPVGYEDRIFRILEQAKCRVRYLDITPPAQFRKPDAYEPDWNNLLRRITLRARQDDALTAVASHDRGVFDAAPGFGKSFLFSGVSLLYPRANIVIGVRGVDLVKKTTAELTKYLPNVGCIYGASKSRGRVTVVSADSLHLLDAERIDIALLDEAHQLLADKYQDAFSHVFRDTRMYGFTATTTGRADGSDARMEAVFGPTIFRLTQQEAEKLSLVVPIEVRWMNVFIRDNPGRGKRDVAHKAAAVWKNRARNEVIAECARRHEDDKVLIIVDTTTHAFALKELLPEFELCYGTIDPKRHAAMLHDGDIPEDVIPLTVKQREALRQDFMADRVRKVIATDVWSTGVSFDSLSVLIRADGRGSTIMDTQIPGRTTRVHAESGKQLGIVYDFMDQFDETLSRRAATRKKNYGDRGWAQLSQIAHWPESMPTAGSRQRRLF